MTNKYDSPATRRHVDRVFWWGVTAASTLVLAISAMLEPDARGYGTHTQLGLPPCGLLALTGAPCPGCGLTTAFAHAIRGDWQLAVEANPLGAVLFVVVGACVPLGATAALRGWSPDAVVVRFGVGRLALALAGCAVAVWVVRLAAVL